MQLIKIFRLRTNVHYLVFHLTVADTITCYITLPMETIWKATIGVSSKILLRIWLRFHLPKCLHFLLFKETQKKDQTLFMSFLRCCKNKSKCCHKTLNYKYFSGTAQTGCANHWWWWELEDIFCLLWCWWSSVLIGIF